MTQTASPFHVVVLFTALFVCSWAQNEKQEITIVAINSLSSGSGRTITGAEWLAIEEINNNSNILPNYKLNFEIYDTEGGQLNVALDHVLNIINSETQSCLIDNSSNITKKSIFPILLGVSRSSISTLIASVSGVNYNGLMSAVSTSVALSDTETYPYFYRTIASDSLQSKGIIFLCNTFNWKSIVVIYANDAYGLYLSLEIQELGKLNDIDVTSIAIQYEDDITYTYAARQVNEINKYIIIFIHNYNGIVGLLNAFKDEGIVGYPYYYLGVDGWFDASQITDDFGDLTQGFIGTLPWYVSQLNLHQYDTETLNIVNSSLLKTTNLLNSWLYLYNNGEADNLRIENPRAYVVYAYDVMYCIAYIIQEIENQYGINSMINMIQNNSTKQIIKLLNDTIINTIDFIGASGHVSFDENGDRKNGLFSFGNILKNGSIEYFGYFYEGNEENNNSLQAFIDINKIKWPSYFVEKGIIPHSDIIIYEELITINISLSIPIFILSSIAIIIIISAIIFVIYYRSNKIILQSSWRMNIIMCTGCIFAFLSAVLFGIDEHYIANINIMNIFCKLQIWILCISFTVTAMPLFLKTWRLVRIFNTMLMKRNISDKQLFICLIICILMDIILLTIFMAIESFERNYENGIFREIDELQYIQQIYGVCSFSDNSIKSYFYIILSLWKFSQLLFGIYVALNVARIHNENDKHILSIFVKFDETTAQLGSIISTFIILCIGVLLASFISIDSPSFKYGCNAVIIIIVAMIVFLSNLLPRIIAVITKNNNKYNKSVEEKFKERLKKQISKIHFEPDTIESPENNKIDVEINNISKQKNVETHIELKQ